MSYNFNMKEKEICIIKMFGDGHYWRERIKNLVLMFHKTEFELHNVVFWTCRSWKAYAKLLNKEGYQADHMISEVLDNGTEVHRLYIDVDRYLNSGR